MHDSLMAFHWAQIRCPLIAFCLKLQVPGGLSQMTRWPAMFMSYVSHFQPGL